MCVGVCVFVCCNSHHSRGIHIARVCQNNSKCVHDANIPRELRAVTYLIHEAGRGWQGLAMPCLAPTPLTSPSTGSSSNPTTLLYLKLNLFPPKNAAKGAIMSQSHLEDAWLS